MIEPDHPRLSIVRQCELVSISRSGFYHRPAGETLLNLELMRRVDAQFCSRTAQRGRKATPRFTQSPWPDRFSGGKSAGGGRWAVSRTRHERRWLCW